MQTKYAIVVTTINAPTAAVRDLASGAGRLAADFIVIGDSKSPATFDQEGAAFYSIEDQISSGFKFAKKVPTRHYARKNVGYLLAARGGAEIIIETDDDNLPREEFWTPRQAMVTAPVLVDSGWVNVYTYYASGPIWPRGLPLDQVQKRPPSLQRIAPAETYCPIQQGLADENPDVDAIYRLIMPLPISFERRGNVVLGPGAWCPFNSQNTTFFRDAFSLLYLPYYCSFRMTDIWRSFVAQRLCHVNGWGVLFHDATVWQDRNEHSLMRDFEDEVPGYLNNDRIRTVLEGLDLSSGVDQLPDGVRACYRALVDIGVVGEAELPLLDAWLDDLTGIQ